MVSNINIVTEFGTAVYRFALKFIVGADRGASRKSGGVERSSEQELQKE